MIHKLKTWIPLFSAVENNLKTFEVRYNDRNYQVGDYLILQEYDFYRKNYTGREIKVFVTYIFDNPFFVKEGYIIMSITKEDDK